MSRDECQLLRSKSERIVYALKQFKVEYNGLKQDLKHFKQLIAREMAAVQHFITDKAF